MLATDPFTHGITAALTIFVLGLLAPLARRAPQQVGDSSVLRLPKRMRVVCWTSIALFVSALVGLTVSVLVGAGDPKLVRLLWIAVPFVTILTLGALGELRVRLSIDAEGIGGQTAFRGQRRIAWRDIVDVRWSNAGYWLRLQDRNGEVLRVSAWLQGHALVVDMLQQHVARQVWQRAVDGWSKRPVQ